MRSVSLASAVTEVKTLTPLPENARLAGHLVAISKTRPGFFSDALAVTRASRANSPSNLPDCVVGQVPTADHDQQLASHATMQFGGGIQA
jgi:hypothetical protein